MENVNGNLQCICQLWHSNIQNRRIILHADTKSNLALALHILGQRRTRYVTITFQGWLFQLVSWSRKSLPFMEPEGSFLCSLKHDTKPYTEPDIVSTPPPPIFSFLTIHYDIIFPSITGSLNGLFLSHSNQNSVNSSHICYAFCTLYPSHSSQLVRFEAPDVFHKRL